MTDFNWRGLFGDSEVNTLPAQAFSGRVFADDEWDWASVVERYSPGLGGRSGRRPARRFPERPLGRPHPCLAAGTSWFAESARHRGVGAQMVVVAADAARSAGCEWLHVDFDPALRNFYLGACGFEPSEAGLLRLSPR